MTEGLAATPTIPLQTNNADACLHAVVEVDDQFSRFEVLALRYADGIDPEPEVMHAQYLVAMESLAEALPGSTSASTAICPPNYRGSLEDISEKMAEFRAQLEPVPTDQRHFSELAGKLDSVQHTLRILVNELRENSALAHKAPEEVIDDNWAFAISLLSCVASLLCVAVFAAKNSKLKWKLKHFNEVLRAQEREISSLENDVLTKTTILGTIGHELKTPLQTIISSVDLLANRSRSARDLEVIERLNNGAGRLHAQMQDLIDYARLESGRVELRKMEFSPGDLVRRVAGDLKETAERKGLLLIQQVEGENRMIIADEYRIQQILANLLTNAIKYSSEGEIQITAGIFKEASRHELWRLRLSVEDAGPGIAATELPRLFEPFTRIEQSEAHRLDSAGLGLAIVRRLVDLFGGKISVNSVVGRGSHFEVVLPVDVAPPQSAG